MSVTALIVNKSAGQDFGGTEFNFAAALSRPQTYFQTRSLHLKMGAESRAWKVEKVDAEGNRHLLFGMTDATTALTKTGADFNIQVLPSESIQVTTTGSTLAMACEIVGEIVDNRPPKTT